MPLQHCHRRCARTVARQAATVGEHRQVLQYAACGSRHLHVVGIPVQHYQRCYPAVVMHQLRHVVAVAPQQLQCGACGAGHLHVGDNTPQRHRQPGANAVTLRQRPA